MLNKRFGNIKGAVSDLHRDVTTRRCLTSYDRVEDIVKECVTIKTELDKADDMMDDHKMEFEKRWHQEQLRIKTEQAMFNEQVGRLESEIVIILIPTGGDIHCNEGRGVGDWEYKLVQIH